MMEFTLIIKGENNNYEKTVKLISMKDVKYISL